jgi:hypothetical protein
MCKNLDKKIKKATELTQEWYKLIGGDHHKDRDCHFYIEATFSYGDPPIYRLTHNGYLSERIKEEYHDYESAIDGLINLLKYIIKNEQDYCDNGEL